MTRTIWALAMATALLWGQQSPQQYPQQYPGGQLPGGIPMPPIKWPKKKPKEEGKQNEVQKFEGTLRSLGEKEMVIDAPGEGLVRFRLLQKTRFRDKKGDFVRDSLLKSGDLVEVETDADDPETARAVVLVKKGTGAPPPPPQAESPKKDEPAAVVEKHEDVVIESARDAASAFVESLGGFRADKVVTRLASFNNEASWNEVDVARSEVALGAETDIAASLDALFGESAQAVFKPLGDDRAASRAAHLYEFSVAEENSKWVLVAQDGRKQRVAFKGQVWIDKESRRALRIEQQAVKIPSAFPLDKAEEVLEFGFAEVGGTRALAPLRAEARGCARATVNCSKSVTEYKNHRK